MSAARARRGLARRLRLLALAACALAGQAGAAAQTILTVDADYLQTAMPLYTRVAMAAERAAEGAGEERRGLLELARDQRLSDILTALPEEIARLAVDAGADLVLDRAVARRLGENQARDITAEVESALAARFEQLPLEGTP